MTTYTYLCVVNYLLGPKQIRLLKYIMIVENLILVISSLNCHQPIRITPLIFHRIGRLKKWIEEQSLRKKFKLERRDRIIRNYKLLKKKKKKAKKEKKFPFSCSIMYNIILSHDGLNM